MDKDKVKRLEDIGLSVLTGGHEGAVDDFMLIREVIEGIATLEKTVATLEKTISSKGPVCPLCKTQMTGAAYKGYYDSFPYWSCQCDDEDIPVEYTWNGSYG